MAAPIAAVGIGATLVSGFMTAAGDLFGGSAQSNQFKYQAGVARQRALVAEQNSRWAISAGEQNALVSGMGTRFRVGQIAAGQGASNITPTSGSSAAVRAGQTKVGQMEESTIRTNAARRAYGYDVEAAAETASAGALDVGASTAKTASYIAAGASILGAAGSVSSKWIQASKAGIGSGSGGESSNPLAADPAYLNVG